MYVEIELIKKENIHSFHNIQNISYPCQQGLEYTDGEATIQET